MIHLRPVLAGDADDLFPLIYQTRVPDTLMWDGPESLESYRQALAERQQQTAAGEAHVFTIVESATGRPVGSASLRPDQQRFRADLGLWVGEPFQGKGYGTQAIRELLAYGFEKLGLQKIEAFVFTGNWASRKAHEKNGFLQEGTVRKAVLKRGRPVDEWLLGITREEYLARSAEFSAWIVHLCPRASWQSAQAAGEYRAPSLETEGFIHASRPGQILQVANSFYAGLPDLLLLWIDPHKVQAEIRWEIADGQEFPHIYGPLNLDTVQAVLDFPPDADGVFRRIPFPQV